MENNYEGFKKEIEKFYSTWLDNSFQLLEESLPQPKITITRYEGTIPKVKTFYHTFDLGKRKVTLSLVASIDDVIVDIYIGHSVKSPDDDFNEELGQKIAKGRAKSKSRLFEGYVSTEIFNKFVAKEMLKMWEHKFKNHSEHYIKSLNKR